MSAPNKNTFINNPKKDLEQMIHLYLASNPSLIVDRKTNELEIRFGAKTKINYENVVKQLYNYKFTSEYPQGIQMLRIQNEYTDNQGKKKCSNIRAELVGINVIQEYCQKNKIEHLELVKFTEKTSFKKQNGEFLRPIDFSDHNFRVSFQTETDLEKNSRIVQNILNNWTNNKKCFRYINRVRYSHPDYPFFVDISIVKTNKKINNNVPIPTYTIQEANVFKNIESYEVELELDNSRVGNGTEYDTPDKIIKAIRKGVRIILGAFQETQYPITQSEQNEVLQSYMKLLHGDKWASRKITSSDFIGYSSYTLQMENAVKETEKTNIPNIRNNYTVTDKADGERKLLYISDNGKIYLINTNMNVIFTGTYTEEKQLFNSLFDGEHILFDKHGKYINYYASFDVYYVFKKSVRELPFYKLDENDIEFRLFKLQKSMSMIKPKSIIDKENEKHSCNFIIECKKFYTANENMTIFDGCRKILADIDNGIYQYNTDGLIFTPSYTGVCSDRAGTAGKLTKTTWDLSFKWKPSKYNTIDFLVSVKKTKDGKDEIHYVFHDGDDATGIKNVSQYKTLILRCGFSIKMHGYLNPFQDIIDDNIQIPRDKDDDTQYKPVPFQPTKPYDPRACFCNVLLQDSGDGSMIMKTEEGEYFEEDMIVEFSYDPHSNEDWKWKPLRVRYDKTIELRQGRNNYGNAYHVANSNWRSIHNPITKEMVISGIEFPEYNEDGDVYYNRHSKESYTKSLRNFHNLYVKKKLITSVSHRNHTLIDYAVGKAGDLSKWREGKLGFVFGVDVSKDNIHNNLDGACARYISERKKYDNMFGALFVVGNSSRNIREGNAFSTEKDKMVADAVFGNSVKDKKLLGNGVYKYHGIGKDGFHVSSCQFAIHYFFENETTVNNFIRNVAECTAMNGYFIGTCYDGQIVFNKLKPMKKNENITISKKGNKIFEITKLYDVDVFADDEKSLGLPINVYQETINNVFREYLVNFQYLVSLMNKYGFILISDEESNKLGLPRGSGLFNELFNIMENEIKANPQKKYDYGDSLNMTKEEKEISYMNRYFVFKKTMNVNVKEMKFTDTFDGKKEHNKMNLNIRKLKKRKFIIQDYSPIVVSSS